MKARPDFRVYLSSSVTRRTRSGAFMSPSILPGHKPRLERFADLGRPLERRKMAASLYDLERSARNPGSDLLVPIQRRDRVLAAAEDQRRAGDGRQER